MQKDQRELLEKVWIFKRIGYSLVAVVLIFFLLLTYTPEYRSPALALYSYVLLGLGLGLIVLNKVLETIQMNRLKEAHVRCQNCGWNGLGGDWARYQCCPECDSEEVRETSGD